MSPQSWVGVEAGLHTGTAVPSQALSKLWSAANTAVQGLPAARGPRRWPRSLPGAGARPPRAGADSERTWLFPGQVWTAVCRGQHGYHSKGQDSRWTASPTGTDQTMQTGVSQTRGKDEAVQEGPRSDLDLHPRGWNLAGPRPPSLRPAFYSSPTRQVLTLEGWKNHEKRHL